MKKSIVKICLRKKKFKITKVIINIKASFNNTIITITNIKGQILFWDSVGTSGFIGAKKRTLYAVQITTLNAITKLINQGMQRVKVMIKDSGFGRDIALRTICKSGILLSFILDVTTILHNGCRPPKKRHV